MVAGLKPGVLNQNMGSVPNPNPVCKCSKPTAKLSKVWELILLGLANPAPPVARAPCGRLRSLSIHPRPERQPCGSLVVAMPTAFCWVEDRAHASARSLTCRVSAWSNSAPAVAWAASGWLRSLSIHPWPERQPCGSLVVAIFKASCWVEDRAR